MESTVLVSGKLRIFLTNNNKARARVNLREILDVVAANMSSHQPLIDSCEHLTGKRYKKIAS